MSFFNVVAETTENAVVAEYEPSQKRSDAYQSEAELEAELIRLLGEQGFEYLQIHTEKDLVANLRRKLEELNDYRFSDDEWTRFFREKIANPNDGIVEKTRKIQEDFVQTLKRDDGTTQNIRLIDKSPERLFGKNSLQVLNQYSVAEEDGKRGNRYDVAILVNGLPLVCVELKRRGVALREAFNQIERYQRESFWKESGLFEYVQIFVISNGTNTKYYSNATRFNAVQSASGGAKNAAKTSASFEFASFWADAKNKPICDLIDFARTFFAKRTLLSVLTKYCVFTSEETLLVMRPYQIAAVERILDRIQIASSYKKYGGIEGGGYIWHTTGSGKTLTSFKTARLASKLDCVDKVLFVVDRKDLDYQTMKEYERFEKGAAYGCASTKELARLLAKPDAKIVITTIQKLATFIKNNKGAGVFNERVVLIFDECHRSQFGEMRREIVGAFQKYFMFGFTGTPIFSLNANASNGGSKYLTTEQTFGDRLHSYTIVDAINDKNVLPFRVDYIRTIEKKEGIEDEDVWDVDRQKALLAPERISKIVDYVLKRFDQKTYRGEKKYKFNALTNVAEVASAKRGSVAEVKRQTRLDGFNSIFAVSSVQAAKLYYDEFRRRTAADPGAPRVATIFSYAPNSDDGEAGGALDEENSDSASALDQPSKEFLEKAIGDYNAMFHTSYDASNERFQNYYKDVSLRMKNREIDLLIVVNMFLTGFDATTLNTLWVDKNLKMHGLIQAFSRTNRILNSVKAFGNVVCFRNLQREVDEALALFGNKDAKGIAVIRPFADYYYGGFVDDKGKKRLGYLDAVKELKEKYPLSEGAPVGEEKQKDFIALFGALLKLRNLLLSFDEFQRAEEEAESISERDLQDYLGRYQDLRDEWKRKRETGGKKDIIDDVVFEIELIRQIEINIDYILTLVQQYRDERGSDKDVLVRIRKAVDASPELRSKRELIDEFIAKINDETAATFASVVEGAREEFADVPARWREFVAEEREKELTRLVEQERLRELPTRQFLESAFQRGEMQARGADFDRILPPASRFGGGDGGDRLQKKQVVARKLETFYEKFRGVSSEKFVEESLRR